MPHCPSKEIHSPSWDTEGLEGQICPIPAKCADIPRIKNKSPFERSKCQLHSRITYTTPFTPVWTFMPVLWSKHAIGTWNHEWKSKMLLLRPWVRANALLWGSRYDPRCKRQPRKRPSPEGLFVPGHWYVPTDSHVDHDNTEPPTLRISALKNMKAQKCTMCGRIAPESEFTREKINVTTFMDFTPKYIVTFTCRDYIECIQRRPYGMPQ